MDFNKLKNNKVFAMISGSIGFLIIIIVIFCIYKFVQKKANEQPFFIKEKRRADFIIVKNKDGSNQRIDSYQRIPASVIKSSAYGHDYTYSIWINIDDWDYNYNKPKHIFSKGDRENNSVNPGVWLYPKDNNIMIQLDTYGRYNNKDKTISGRNCQYWSSQFPHKHDYLPSNYPNAELKDNYCRNPDNKQEGAWCLTNDTNVVWEGCGIQDYKKPPSMDPILKKDDFNTRNQCDIKDIPVQRWVHITISLHNKTLDVYVNGKLTRSCTYENVPKLNDGDLHITDNGGFKGDIGEFRYFNRALDPSEIYSLYSSGYKTFSLYDKFNKIKPKVKLDFKFSASVNDHSISTSTKN